MRYAPKTASHDDGFRFATCERGQTGYEPAGSAPVDEQVGTKAEYKRKYSTKSPILHPLRKNTL